MVLHMALRPSRCRAGMESNKVKRKVESDKASDIK